MRSLTTSKPFKPWFTEKEVKVYNTIREVANNHPLATKITEAIFHSTDGYPINLDKLAKESLEPIDPYENCDVLRPGDQYLIDE